jgi:hypothetical protein
MGEYISFLLEDVTGDTRTVEVAAGRRVFTTPPLEALRPIYRFKVVTGPA